MKTNFKLGAIEIQGVRIEGIEASAEYTIGEAKGVYDLVKKATAELPEILENLAKDVEQRQVSFKKFLEELNPSALKETEDRAKYFEERAKSLESQLGHAKDMIQGMEEDMKAMEKQLAKESEGCSCGGDCSSKTTKSPFDIALEKRAEEARLRDEQRKTEGKQAFGNLGDLLRQAGLFANNGEETQGALPDCNCPDCRYDRGEITAEERDRAISSSMQDIAKALGMFSRPIQNPLMPKTFNGFKTNSPVNFGKKPSLPPEIIMRMIMEDLRRRNAGNE